MLTQWILVTCLATSLVRGTPVTEQVETICDDCKTFVGDLKVLLLGDQERDNIEQLWGEACESMFGWRGGTWFLNLCTEIGEDFVVNIMNYLNEKLDFSYVCEATLCSDDDFKTKQGLKQAIVLYATSKDSPSGNVKCDTCKALVQLVNMFLTDESFEKLCDNVFDSTCALLPKTYRDQCKSFIDSGVHQMIQTLTDELQGDELICQSMDMCPTSANENQSTFLKSTKRISSSFDVLSAYLNVEGESVGDKIGNAAKNVMGHILAVSPLVKSSSQTTINQALSEVKNAINSNDDDFKELGLNMISTVKYEIQNILKDSRVQDLIKAFNEKLYSFKTLVNSQGKDGVVLTAQSLLGSLMSSSPSQSGGSGSSQCTMCTIITKEFLSSLRSSEKAAISTLGELCTEFLPDPIASQCKRLVDQDGPVLLNEVLDMLTPEVICRAIDMCEGVKVVEKSQVGVGESILCTWCSSLFDDDCLCELIGLCDGLAAHLDLPETEAEFVAQPAQPKFEKTILCSWCTKIFGDDCLCDFLGLCDDLLTPVDAVPVNQVINEVKDEVNDGVKDAVKDEVNDEVHNGVSNEVNMWCDECKKWFHFNMWQAFCDIIVCSDTERVNMGDTVLHFKPENRQ